MRRLLSRRAPEVAIAPSDKVGQTAAIEADSFRRLLDAGDWVAAAEMERALGAQGDSSAVFQLLKGRLALSQNDPGRAQLLFKKSLQIDPSFVEAHFFSAVLAMQRGLEAEALVHAQAVERLRPGIFEIRAMIGIIQANAGNLANAIATFQSALQLEPQNPVAHTNLASAYERSMQWSDAIECHRNALSLRPDSWQNLAGMAGNLVATGQEAEAWQAFERAIALSNGSSDVYRKYAVTLFNQGLTERARAQFLAGIARHPEEPVLHVGLANCDLIIEGGHRDSWAAYEWRQRMDPERYRILSKRWPGKRASGGRLMVYAEQGMGDMCMFARYLPGIRSTVDELIVQIPPALGRLMRYSAARFDWKITDWVERAVRVGPAEMPYDYELPLMSVLHECEFPIEATTRPYLDVDPELVKIWSARLGPAPDGRLRVGLVWAGNPKREEDYLRCIFPEQLKPLAAVERVDFVSLQMEAKPVYKTPQKSVPLLDLTSQIADFADTAAIMRNLDLVLSIDTAAAHLAGAIGVPCWLLLSKIPDWRWHMGGVSQPWYGNHRSFIASKNCEWVPLLQKVADELEKAFPQLISNRSRTRQPVL